MMSEPRIHVAPFVDPRLEAAVINGGGTIVPPEQAEAIVWTDPFHPQPLKELLSKTPARWVQLPMAGVERFFEAGIIDEGRVWTCAKGIYGYACAEHALAFMVMAARYIHHHIRERSWEFAGAESPHRMLKGQTVLILGTGGIGRALARLLEPFSVEILAVNRSGTPLPGADKTETSERLADLVPEADFIVIAAALTQTTYHLFNEEMLARIRPGAWLVNVARGGLVDSDALVGELAKGTMGGAALDVTEPEPLPDDHPLWAYENVIITPHVANTMSMSLPQLADLVNRNTRKFATGEELESLIDPSAGY